jgi:UDP-N-acetyl-D-glucosamine dehydrogenase
MVAKDAPIGIVGLGYVGLPLALTFVERGAQVVGFDIDPAKPEQLQRGESYLRHIAAERVAAAVEGGRLTTTTDFSGVAACRAVILCVPTPISATREPDLSFVESSARTIAPSLRRGQVVSLESTTYPGTTREVLLPLLEAGSGLKAGEDFHLVYSPEREDPGNADFGTQNIPKLVAGLTEPCLRRGRALYAEAIAALVEVPSLETAELTKLFENVFRAVNIALVNELKMLTHRMSERGMPIDVFDVIEAASTKPFGFMPFWPGPGLGGHCIPIDPFYLTWKARTVDLSTRFIELAGEINTHMPHYVVERTLRALSDEGKGMRDAKVLVLGVAYKPNVDDMRESPALRILELFGERGAEVAYHDPFVPELKPTRKHDLGLRSVPLDRDRLRWADVVVVVTPHDELDLELVADAAALIVDTRGVLRRFAGAREIVRA